MRIVCIVSLVACAVLADEAPGRHFACADYSQGKVFIFAPGGEIEWEADAPACDEMWVLPNGNVLFTTGNGVTEMDRDKNVVFRYESKTEVYACQRLANGNTFVGECNTGRLFEVTPAGETVHEIRLLPEGTDGGHAYIRNCRRLPNGNTLVSHYSDQAVREYDPAGNVVWEAPAVGGAHSVVRLPSGNTLVSCGDAGGDTARVFEVSPDGTVVWQVTSADVPEMQNKFIAGIQRLPNGNTLLCNWLGHGHLGEASHIIEVTPEKQVVWTWSDHDRMRTAAAVQVLDIEGDATLGTVLR